MRAVSAYLCCLLLVQEHAAALHVSWIPVSSCLISTPINLFKPIVQPVFSKRISQSISLADSLRLLSCRGRLMTPCRTSRKFKFNQIKNLSGDNVHVSCQDSDSEGGGSVIGAAALIAGTTIGGGFLGLPHFTRDLVMALS